MWPRKSVPKEPNSSCAISQGREERGGGSESGSGSPLSSASTLRSCSRRAVK